MTTGAKNELIAVLESLPSRKELAVRSSRTGEVKEWVLELCKLRQENETIEKFSSELSSLLWSVIPSGTKLDRKERR